MHRDEFQALLALSAEVGANPALVQAAGGNTSIKESGILWIKASGTWLKDALSDDIFVPVALDPLLGAFAAGDPAVEKAQDFVVALHNPRGLRPSIETTVHAVMPQRVVVHVHCIETIAAACLADQGREIEARLKGMAYALIPYARPGLPLARAIVERLKPDTEILVLGNHGLVVAAETVAAAALLLRRVCGLLSQTPRAAPAADIPALERAAHGSPYQLPADPMSHGAATDLANCRIAAGGSLYPDHVIFLGPGSVIAGPKQTAQDVVAARQAAGRAAPVSILFPGKGVLMRADATAGAQALARCLAEVTARIGERASVRYLSEEDTDRLTNWDAEKYRQGLDARKVGSG